VSAWLQHNLYLLSSREAVWVELVTTEVGGFWLQHCVKNVPHDHYAKSVLQIWTIFPWIHIWFWLWLIKSSRSGSGF
jgi:hypothetical protein